MPSCDFSVSSEELSTPSLKPLKIPCPHCPKVLSRRDKLKQHVKNQHPGLPLPVFEGDSGDCFTCPICQKKLSRKDILEKHINNVHLNTNKREDVETEWRKVNYKNPDKCEKGFNSKGIVCPYCSKPLSRVDKLKPHLKSKHPEAKVENIKKIVQSSRLARKLEDSVIKGIACPYCSKILSRADKLKPHIKTKHPEAEAENIREMLKISRKLEDSMTNQKEQEVTDPWELLWGGKELVYLKFNFNKSKNRRRRASEVSVDLESFVEDDFENSTELQCSDGNFNHCQTEPIKSFSPVSSSISSSNLENYDISKLSKPPKPQISPPKCKIRILEAKSYKKKN